MGTRKMPTCDAIRRHWAEKLVEIGKFDSVQEVMEANYCFACGMIVESVTQPAEEDQGQVLERAHIKARCEGGTDDLDNLHLLCEICHKDSEFHEGTEYWDWLGKRTAVDVAISGCYRHKIPIEPHHTIYDMLKMFSQVKRRTIGTRTKEALIRKSRTTHTFSTRRNSS